MEISKIREAVAGLARARNGKLLCIPNALRQEITRGATQFWGGMRDFATEVGLSYATIMGWEKKPVRKKGKAGAFRRLEVRPEVSDRLFALEGPKGLKVGNLTLREIATLFKEVSREF